MIKATQNFKHLLIGLAVALSFLLLLEGGTRLLPLAEWEKDRPNLSYPLFIPGQGEFSDQYVTNPHFLGAMSRQHFPKVKAPGVQRVFVLGGSAALGWPGPVDSSFTGYLDRALEKSQPGQYEIINVAAMSYGSHRVLDLLYDVVKMEPDVIIVWSGNNEYIERNAFSPYARTPMMGKMQRTLRHSSLYRSLRLGLQVTVPSLFVRQEAGDITDPRTVPQVRRGMMGRADHADRQVLENYRSNLQSMASVIKASGANAIFCTVPVNLSSWAPTNVPPDFADQGSFDRWQALRLQIFTLWDQKRFAEAMPLLEQLLKIAPDYALAHYLTGLGFQKDGQLAEAKAAFNRARDLDLRPFRALSTFAPAVRDVAVRHGVRVVDLEQAFVEHSGADLSGAELFIDYVHPTEKGAKLAATLILEELLRGTATSPAAAKEFILADDWYSRSFDWQADYYYALGMTYQNNGDFGRAEEAYLLVLQEDPAMPEAAGNLGLIYERQGDLNAARHYYAQAVRSDPGTVIAGDLARVLYQQGDLAGARQMGQRIIAQGIVNIDLLVLLGDIDRETGQPQSARNYYQQAIDAGGDENNLRLRIAATYQ